MSKPISVNRIRLVVGYIVLIVAVALLLKILVDLRNWTILLNSLGTNFVDAVITDIQLSDETAFITYRFSIEDKIGHIDEYINRVEAAYWKNIPALSLNLTIPVEYVIDLPEVSMISRQYWRQYRQSEEEKSLIRIGLQFLLGVIVIITILLLSVFTFRRSKKLFTRIISSA